VRPFQPGFVSEDELAEYLCDLLHESALPKYPNVVHLPD
jgi:hypothetical protein